MSQPEAEKLGSTKLYQEFVDFFIFDNVSVVDDEEWAAWKMYRRDGLYLLMKKQYVIPSNADEFRRMYYCEIWNPYISLVQPLRSFELPAGTSSGDLWAACAREVNVIRRVLG